MFDKLKWSQNMFLWIRKVFCSHQAYPKPFFVYRSILKPIENEFCKICEEIDSKMRNPLIKNRYCRRWDAKPHRRLISLGGLQETLWQSAPARHLDLGGLAPANNMREQPYAKPHFVYRSILKLIGNRIY